MYIIKAFNPILKVGWIIQEHESKDDALRQLRFLRESAREGIGANHVYHAYRLVEVE